MNALLAVSLSSLLFFGYTSQIFIILPWHDHPLSPEPLQLLLPFNFFIGMFLWNYYLAATTDPGRVPDDWHKATTANGAEAKDLNRKLRYCDKCKKYKPPRTYHCSTCNRCILRMDHHCPWIGQCVGHFNHGYLIRSLFYANIICIYHIGMISRHIYINSFALNWDSLFDPEVIVIALNYANVIPFFCCVIFFSHGQLPPLFRNRTIIEVWKEENLEEDFQAKYPYDLGVRRNVEALLGQNPLLWWFPCRPSGDGTSYPIVEGSEEPWPPIPEVETKLQEPSLQDSDFAQQYLAFISEARQAIRQHRALRFAEPFSPETLPD